MKSFIKLLFMFLLLGFALIAQPQDLQAEQIDYNGYITSINKENVELVSNNLFRGEISSCQEEQTQNSNSNTTYFIAFDYKNNLYTSNKDPLKGQFIHNLSANLKEEKQTRAP